MNNYYLKDANTFQCEGYDVFNLYMSHAVNSKLTVYGRVQNLFNMEYAERADYKANIPDYRYFVGQKRYLHVGASYSF